MLVITSTYYTLGINNKLINSMYLHLDSKDLINILEKSQPCDVNYFENKLISNGHTLILSFFNVLEISAPLVYREATTNVMNLLNRLEKMPLKFISEGKIPKLELNEAIKAFMNSKEYKRINPFVKRFDEAVEINGSPSTKYFINFGLAETVFTIWREAPQVFAGYQKYTKKLRNSFFADRALSEPPKLRDNFIKAIKEKLKLYKLEFPNHLLKSFAEWIYDSNLCCPSIRLDYEVYHKLLKNKDDVPKDGDLCDFSHVSCIPYVDLITLDRRMSTYVIQACSCPGLNFKNKVFKSIKEVIKIL